MAWQEIKCRSLLLGCSKRYLIWRQAGHLNVDFTPPNPPQPPIFTTPYSEPCLKKNKRLSSTRLLPLTHRFLTPGDCWDQNVSLGGHVYSHVHIPSINVSLLQGLFGSKTVKGNLCWVPSHYFHTSLNLNWPLWLTHSQIYSSPSLSFDQLTQLPFDLLYPAGPCVPNEISIFLVRCPSTMVGSVTILPTCSCQKFDNQPNFSLFSVPVFKLALLPSNVCCHRLDPGF